MRDELAVPDSLPSYGDVMAFYNDLAVETQAAIESMDFTDVLGDVTVEVTSRSKTIDTLRQKLQRDRATPLSSIQDVAGVRFEAAMTLSQQDAVVRAIIARFGHSTDSIRDLRNDPHSGYRAVHIWLRLPARVEVQVRTHLQGGWANLYEVTADIFGRNIRYGQIPEDEDAARLVREFQQLSITGIRQLEEVRGGIEDIRLAISKSGGDLGRRLVDIPSSLTSSAAFQDLVKGAKGGKVSMEDLATKMDAEARRIEGYVSVGVAGMTESLMMQGKGFTWPAL